MSIPKKKENEDEIVNPNNQKEKKLITVELSNDEKIVYSQLGINPLVKLGKQYLNSNHLVRLEDINNKKKEPSIEKNKKSSNKVSIKKENKKISTSNPIEKFEVNDSKELNPDDKLITLKTSNEEKEQTDEMDNPRRKRRRSSASLE